MKGYLWSKYIQSHHGKDFKVDIHNSSFSPLDVVLLVQFQLTYLNNQTALKKR